MSKLGLLSLLVVAAALHGETGYDAWLRYAPLEGAALDQVRQAAPAVVSLLDQSPVALTARAERGKSNLSFQNMAKVETCARRYPCSFSGLQRLRHGRTDFARVTEPRA